MNKKNNLIKFYIAFFLIYHFFQPFKSFSQEQAQKNHNDLKFNKNKKLNQTRQNKIKPLLSAGPKSTNFIKKNHGEEEGKILEYLNISEQINYDQTFIKNLFSHALKHEWNILNQGSSNAKNKKELTNFLNLIKYANYSKNNLSFNEGYVFDFLSNKHQEVSENFIALKINKKTPDYFNQINENNISNSTVSTSPSGLIARFRKNKSLIHDKNFVFSVKKAWHSKKFSSTVLEGQFFEIFKKIITKLDHDERFENMLWNGNFEAAIRILSKISITKKNQMQNRIKILNAKSFSEVQNLLNYSKKRGAAEYQTTLFDAICWCGYHELKQKKFELLSGLKSLNIKTLNKHWQKLLKENKRELLSTNNPKLIDLAYHFAVLHIEKPKTTDFVEAEFLAGFIAFNFLHDYNKAIHHFYTSYKNAENPNRVSRGAYWIGLSLKKLGKGVFENLGLNNSSYWFNLGSKNFTSFYGQLCAFESDSESNPIKKYLISFEGAAAQNVKNHPLFSYYYYSLLTKNFDLSSKIGKIFALSLKKKNEVFILAKLANALNMPLVSIHIGNIAKKYLNFTILEALYPTPNYNNLKYNPALIYAIIHQESRFDPKVTSHAGACGLMQLMPETASKVSKQLGVHLNSNNIYESNINSLIGSQYIKNLQNRFNGFSLLSIGAYNAGEHAVDRWINSYGDPRNSRNYFDIVSWIESTSFKETRHYTQTVMANYLIYQTILNQNQNHNLGKMLFH